MVSSNPVLPFSVPPALISPLLLSHLDPLQPSPRTLSLPSIPTFSPIPSSPQALLLAWVLSPSCHLFSPMPTFSISTFSLHTHFFPLPIFPIRTPQPRFPTSFLLLAHPLSIPSPSRFSPLLLIPTAPPTLPPHSWVPAHMYFLGAHQFSSSPPYTASAPCRPGH